MAFQRLKEAFAPWELAVPASKKTEEWVPISPAGTEGCLWEEDHFDYEALMQHQDHEDESR